VFTKIFAGSWRRGQGAARLIWERETGCRDSPGGWERLGFGKKGSIGFGEGRIGTLKTGLTVYHRTSDHLHGGGL